MKIAVGTKNKAKVEAVKETIVDYPMLCDAEIEAVAVESNVSDQPIGLEETIRGAMNRARSAYDMVRGSAYGFGLESGIFEVPYTKTGLMDTNVCAIYDGKEFHLGFSSCFEYPPKLIQLVKDENLDISQAANKSGVTNNENIGAEEGVIGIVTKGRLTRKGYTQQSIVTALVHLENPELYLS